MSAALGAEGVVVQYKNSVSAFYEYNRPMMNSNCDECRAIAEELREAMTEAAPEQLAKFKELLGPAGDNLPAIDMRHDSVTRISRAHSGFRKRESRTISRPTISNR
jgi:hypothetical protein